MPFVWLVMGSPNPTPCPLAQRSRLYNVLPLDHCAMKLLVSLIVSGRMKSIPDRTSKSPYAMLNNATFSVNQVKRVTGKIDD